MKLMAVIAILVSLAFCSFAQTAEDPLVNISDDSLKTVVITMKRTGCYGTCPAYHVEIHGDGAVMYTGLSYVAVPGEKNYKIPVADVRKLLEKFQKTYFFSLNDKYEATVTDNPSTTVTITINGKTKSVYDYVAGPKKLKDLQNYIDEIADLGKLIRRKQ